MATPMAQRIVAVHEALDRGGIQHAFGGAIALAFHVRHPRATNDIDLNVAVPGDAARQVLSELPLQVRWTSQHVRLAEITGEVKLRWTREGPVDLFFVTGPYHRIVHQRTETHPFAGVDLPVISATDLTVFKTLFDRPQDWVDIQAMLGTGSVDVDEAERRAGEVGGPDARMRLHEAITRSLGP